MLADVRMVYQKLHWTVRCEMLTQPNGSALDKRGGLFTENLLSVPWMIENGVYDYLNGFARPEL